MNAPTFEQIYGAMACRSPKFDGIFFTAVKTTKLFCRPVCPARTPKPENVEFFKTAVEAVHAGYRACKRCRPMDMGVEPPDWIQQLRSQLEKYPEKRIRDQQLREMGLDPVVVRRTWLRRYGHTFHAFQRARRMGVALSTFRSGGDKIDAAINSDYNSDSGFAAAFEKILGAPPSRASQLNPAVSRWIETPLGPMFAVESDGKLALLEFVDRRMLETQLKIFQRRFEQRVIPGNTPLLEQIERELDDYFSGKTSRFETPVVLRGTEFQEAVWRALMDVPYGTTASYAELAQMIGNPEAVRAVARANGDNRIAILIPCHRIIGSDGSLTGYGGGIWRKKRMLELERASLGAG